MEAKAPRPSPSQWIIATNGSASPPSVEAPGSAGWGVVVDRVGVLEGPEMQCWGEVLVDDRDPGALGADALSNNAGELWALAEGGTSQEIIVLSLSLLFMIRRWRKVSSLNPGPA